MISCVRSSLSLIYPSVVHHHWAIVERQFWRRPALLALICCSLEAIQQVEPGESAVGETESLMSPIHSVFVSFFPFDSVPTIQTKHSLAICNFSSHILSLLSKHITRFTSVWLVGFVLSLSIMFGFYVWICNYWPFTLAQNMCVLGCRFCSLLKKCDLRQGKHLIIWPLLCQVLRNWL